MTKPKPLRIYIDMDGVLCDFAKAATELQQPTPPLGIQRHLNSPDLHLDFSTFEPMKDAIESVQLLIDMGHDIFIASTPPWNNPDAWGQKRNWIEKHLPKLSRKVILTHRKDLLIGDILIDDSDYRGQKDFKGTWMHFDPSEGADWKYMVKRIQKRTEAISI